MRIGGRGMAVAGAAVVVIGGGAGAAYATMSSSGPSYRLATVTSAQVTAALDEVGTLMPAQQANVSFPVSGTVATVPARAGQQVTAGQTLGTLDTTDLGASLTAAQSTLANAELKVSNDIASQDTAAGGQTTAPTSPSGQSGPAAGSSLQQLQQAVVNGQRQDDAALAAAKTALTQAGQACPPSTGPSPSPSPSRTAPASSGSATVSCFAATQQLLTDETAVLHDQQALAGQLSALAAALSQAASAAGSSAAGAGGGGSSGANGGGAANGGGSSSPGGAGSAGNSASGNSASGNSASGNTGSGNTGSGPVSAAQLAADQSAVDAATAQVTVAQEDLAGATVVSPLSGTVISVSVTAGASESAGSTAFEVAGLDSWQVQTQVPVSDMPQLRNGQPASVVPDGSTVPLSGAVVTIGLQPTPDSNPVTYPVTIGLTGQPSGLHQGGYAAATITTAQTTGVSVPTSAVHYSATGGHATVTVYTAGKTRVTPVKVGTKGPVMTRITSGLAVGQQVVLANLNTPLPSNNPFSGFSGPGPGGGSFTFVGPGPGGGVSIRQVGPGGG